MSSSRVQASSTAARRALSDPPAEALALPDGFLPPAKVMHCQNAFSRAHHLTSQVRSSRFRSIMSILIIAVDWEIDWEEVSLAR